MLGYVGILVSDPWLQNQFTQVELRSLKSHFLSMRREKGRVALADLPSRMSRLKIVGENLTEDERETFLRQFYPDLEEEVDFEVFLRVYLNMQAHANARMGGSAKSSSAFLKAATTTLLHTISESERTSYVAHINNYLAEDVFLQKYLPIDPTTNDLFEIAKDGVLLCKLINVAVPGTIDERAINTKRTLNPWERNENHTLCLNSAKAIGCTVVNIGTQDFIEGRPHLVLGLISQIIKIQLLADLNLKKTPQLVELVDDGRDVEELMSLAPEKILLRWMNFQLKKGGFEKTITNFSTDVKDGEAYACLLNVLAPEHSSPAMKSVKDPLQRAKLVLEHADRMGCKRYLTPKDIVEGSLNLNLAFVAHIFQHRNGLSSGTKQISFIETISDDVQVSREETSFRLWINSLGNLTYINNVFEDVRDGWVLLEALDKVAPGIVNWKIATKPPIKMPFRKVENCNQVIKIGKQLKFSLVNVAGNDIVQGNKKLILAYLWQLMRYNILQLLKNLRCHSNGKEITDADILNWANSKVRSAGRNSRMQNFKDKSLSDGIFILDLLSAVEPKIVNWSLVTKGESGQVQADDTSDIGWQFGERTGPSRQQIRCKFCRREISAGITRLKHHLTHKKGNVAPCTQVPREVITLMNANLEDIKMKKSSREKEKKATLDVCREEGNLSIINFMVYSHLRSVFMRAIDASGIVKNAAYIFSLMDKMADEVGENNIVQIVTDNEACYKAAGRMLMQKRPHLFWSPCAAHCIDLILEDIGRKKTATSVVEKTRLVTSFIYNHNWVIALMKKFTNGRELLRPGATCFVTNFIALKSLYTYRGALSEMISSKAWMKSRYGKLTSGASIEMCTIIRNNAYWGRVLDIIKVMDPLIKVLRLVESDD